MKSQKTFSSLTKTSCFVAIDFETADRLPDSACSLGLVRVENQKIVHRSVTLIRPPRPSFEFTHIHGITWKQVSNEPTFGEHWNQFDRILGDADFIVAHNAAFDQRVLSACCLAAKVTPPYQHFECTMKLARQQLQIFPTKLPNVCEKLGIELKHHDALSDAEACAQIMLHLCKCEK